MICIASYHIPISRVPLNTPKYMNSRLKDEVMVGEAEVKDTVIPLLLQVDVGYAMEAR